MKKVILPDDVLVDDDDDDSMEEEEDDMEEEDKIEIPPKRATKRKIIYEYDEVPMKKKIPSTPPPIIQKKKPLLQRPLDPSPSSHPIEKKKKKKNDYYMLSKKMKDYKHQWFSANRPEDIHLFQNALVKIMTNDQALLNSHQDTLLREKYLVKLQNILGVKSKKNKDGTRTFHMKEKVPDVRNIVRNIKQLPEPVMLEISRLMKKMV